MPERPEFKRVANVLSFWILSCGFLQRPPNHPGFSTVPYPDVPGRRGAGTRKWWKRRRNKRRWSSEKGTQEEEAVVEPEDEEWGRGWRVWDRDWLRWRRKVEEEIMQTEGGDDLHMERDKESSPVSAGAEARKEMVEITGHEISGDGARDVERLTTDERPPESAASCDEWNDNAEETKAPSTTIEDLDLESKATTPKVQSPNSSTNTSSLSLPLPLVSLDRPELPRRPSSSTCGSLPASGSINSSTSPSTAPDISTLAQPDSPTLEKPEAISPANNQSPPRLAQKPVKQKSPNTTRRIRRTPFHRHHAREAPRRVRELLSRADESVQTRGTPIAKNTTSPRHSPLDKFKQLKEHRKLKRICRRREIEKQHPWYQEIMLTPHVFNSRASFSVSSSSRLSERTSERLGGSLRSRRTVPVALWDGSGQDAYGTSLALTVSQCTSCSSAGIGTGPAMPHQSAAMAADITPVASSTCQSSLFSLSPPAPAQLLPSISPLHPSTRRCVWAANEIKWMVTPIPGVEQRKKVQQELWKRKQVFGPFQGGEDWSMWRLENFVDNGDGDDERSIQSQDTPEAEILMTGTGTDAVLEQTEKMSKHGDGNPEQIPRPSAKPSSLELLERKPSNPSSPPSAPIRRADAIPPPHSKQQKVKLTLDLPDMEPAPSDRPWQPTCSIGFGSSDDDDDEFWTSIASCGLGTAAGGKCGAGRSHAGASAVWSDDSEDVDGLGDGGLASDVAGWSSE